MPCRLTAVHFPRLVALGGDAGELALRVKRLGAELRRSLVPSAARVPSKSLDLVGGFIN
jgi:hypothetical protein